MKVSIYTIEKNNAIIVTTTYSIEGMEISRYIDPIAANVVIGTNIFSDIGAGYVDVIGERSTSYEKKLQVNEQLNFL